MIPSYDFGNVVRLLGLGWVRVARCSPLARHLTLAAAIGGLCAVVVSWFVPYVIPIPDVQDITSYYDSPVWAIVCYCLHLDYFVVFVQVVDRILVATPSFLIGSLVSKYAAMSFYNITKALHDTVTVYTR